MKGWLIFTLIFLVGCFHSRPSVEEEKPLVFVPISPYAFFVKKLAGDWIRLETVIPKGYDPHTYELKPKEIEKIFKAAIWFSCGASFEKKFHSTLNLKGVKVVSLLSGIPLISSDSEIPAHLKEEESDLHVWLNPRFVMIQIEAIGENLSELLPERAHLIREKSRDLLQQLAAFDTQLEGDLKPLEGIGVGIVHPALGYYCERYGIHQISIEQEGKDPRMREVAHIVAEMKRRDVRLLLTEPQYSSKGARLIALELGIPVYEIDPYSEDYFGTLSRLTKLIVQYYGH